MAAGTFVIITAAAMLAFRSQQQCKLPGMEQKLEQRYRPSLERKSVQQEDRILTSRTMVHDYGVQPYAWHPKPLATKSGKIAYLTFDDGPSLNTMPILHILRKFEVKATFFVTGKTSEESIRLYKQIAAEGHVLGNHTFSHDYRTIYASVERFKADVEKLNKLLEQAVGRRPEVMRFPGGSNNRLSRKFGGPHIMTDLAKEMLKSGYPYFDWNVSSTDAADKVQPKQNIVSAVKAGSAGKSKIIVLMHDMDAKNTTVEALPEVIDYLKREGFEFDTLRKSSFNCRFLQPADWIDAQ